MGKSFWNLSIQRAFILPIYTNRDLILCTNMYYYSANDLYLGFIECVWFSWYQKNKTSVYVSFKIMLRALIMVHKPTLDW